MNTEQLTKSLEHMNNVSKKSANELQQVALDAIKIIGHLCTEYNLPVNGSKLQDTLIERMQRSHEQAVASLREGPQ